MRHFHTPEIGATKLEPFSRASLESQAGPGKLQIVSHSKRHDPLYVRGMPHLVIVQMRNPCAMRHFHGSIHGCSSGDEVPPDAILWINAALAQVLETNA